MDNFTKLRKIRRLLEGKSSGKEADDVLRGSVLSDSQKQRLNMLNQIRSGELDTVGYENVKQIAENELYRSRSTAESHFHMPKIAVLALALILLSFAGIMSAAATNSLPSSFQSPLASFFKNVGIQLPTPTTTTQTTAKLGKSVNGNPCKSPVRTGMSCTPKNPGGTNGQIGGHGNPNISSTSSNSPGNSASTSHGSTIHNATTTTTCVNPSQGPINRSSSSHSTVTTPGSKCSAPGQSR